MPPAVAEKRSKVASIPTAEQMKALKPADQEAISWGLHDLANAIREREDLAGAFREGTEAFRDAVKAIKPAADTIHGFGERLDALCAWIKKRSTLAGWGVLFLLAVYRPDLGQAIAQAVQVLRTATGG